MSSNEVLWSVIDLEFLVRRGIVVGIFGSSEMFISISLRDF